jgi:SAM-dependent methyltransferase
MKKCPMCGSSKIKVIYSEPCELRGGIPIMPEGIYNQAFCQVCKLLFVDSNVDDISLKSMYGNEYIDLKLTDPKILEKVEESETMIRLKYNKIRSLIINNDGNKWLDIGSQYGGLLELAKEDGYQVYGIDLCEEYCKFTEKRLSIPRGRMFSKDLLSGDYESNYFDVISIFETIEHIVDFKPYMECIRRILVPGGLFLMSVPVADFQRFRIFVKNKLKFKVGAKSKPDSQLLIHTHIYNFSLKSIRLLFKESNFLYVKAIPIGYFVSLSSSSLINKLWNIMTKIIFVEKKNFTIANNVLVIGRKI